VAIALAIALVQRERDALGVDRRIAGAHQAAADLGRRAAARTGVERVAAEQIHFLELREETGTGRAARRALQLVDRERLARVEPARVELGSVVEVSRDEKDVTAHALPARGCEPVGPAALHQLDELELVRGKMALEAFLLVG